MNNWDDLLKALVPLVFMAIWAITSILNRDTRPKGMTATPSRPNPSLANRPRPGEPTLRFGSVPGSGSSAAPARPLSRPQDEIVILSSNMAPPRAEPTRAATPVRTPARRPAKGRPSVPERRAEPSTSRNTRLAGVSQNVNQQLANTSIEMTPLAGLAPIGTSAPLGLRTAGSTAGSAATATQHEAARPAIARTLADPQRIREAFLLNEILSRPVALRGRPPGPGPGSGATRRA